MVGAAGGSQGGAGIQISVMNKAKDVQANQVLSVLQGMEENIAKTKLPDEVQQSVAEATGLGGKLDMQA